MPPIESSLEGNEGNMGEIWGTIKGEPLQERARLNTISWDFPRGEIIRKVLKMPCTSHKPK